MSNLINNILPNESVATPNASASSEQTLKDKPSLFDSLLTNATATPEESKIVSDMKQEVKEVKTEEIVTTNSEEINLENGEIKKEQIDLSKTDEVDSEGQKVSGISSLLDRLILEAKTSAKEENVADNIVNKVNSDVTLKQEIKPEEIAIINVEETKIEDSEIQEQSVVTKKAEETDAKEVVSKNTKESVTANLVNVSDEIGKDNPSLFDSLLKNDLTTKEIKIATDVKQEIKTEETVVVNTEETKEKIINNLTEKIDTKTKDIIVGVTLAAEETKVKKSEIVKELEVKKASEINSDTVETELSESVLSVGTLSTGTNEVLDNNTQKKALIDSEVDSNIQLVEEAKVTNLEMNSESILPSEVIEKSDIDLLEKVDVKKDVKTSLMDQLIQKNSEKLVLDTTNEIGENTTAPLKEGLSKDLISNIYLGSQKNKINNQTLFNKNEAISLLKDANSIQAVKASAEMLDLGLQSINIEKDIDVENIDLKKSNIDLLNKKNLIDNLLLKNDIRGEEVKELITKSVEASKALIDNTLTVADDTVVNVNSPLSYNIQSKIIGAKQQMSAMMSDIAKQMYENYKPPVTAFKINLNPLDLGSIAILMKSDKNSGLTITMNVSNNVTLETLIENQNVLKNSLNKTFDENTKFNLDFGSSNQNNSNQSSNNEQRSNRQFGQQMDTKSILELQEENKDREEKVIDYM